LPTFAAPRAPLSIRRFIMKKSFAISLALACACGGSSNKNYNAGFDPGCQPASGNALNATCNPGFTQTAPNKGGTIEVTFSGELLGQAGLPFPTAPTLDPFFVDGWSMTFDEILFVVGNFRLSPGATQYADWGKLNPVVATKSGPYVVDMHKPTGFTGKDGVEPAQAIFKWDTQDNGQPFDTSARYAFSYDAMKAAYPVAAVNLTADQKADYDLMVSKGWSKFYRGTATYVGNGSYPTNTGCPTCQAHFAALPRTVKFFFGWNDATSYLNCNNPDNAPATGLASRGIQPSPSKAMIAQITLHVDHVFWDKVLFEGTPLHFDPIAAWDPASAATTAVDLTPLLVGKPLATTFSDGLALPDRGPYQNIPGGYTSDQANPLQFMLNLNTLPLANAPDMINFMAFSAQSQMHLNADGLCYVVGQHDGDPFYTPNIR
jgi:hypothetical protein